MLKTVNGKVTVCQMTKIDEKLDEFKQLRNLQIYGWYLKGARKMLLDLTDLFAEQLKIGRVKTINPYNKAVIDMLFESNINLEKFLLHDYDEIRFKDFVKNKKGKLIKCKAFLVKRTQTSVRSSTDPTLDGKDRVYRAIFDLLNTCYNLRNM